MKTVLLLTTPLQRRLRDAIVDTLQQGEGAHVEYDSPPGDPGLFGPHSVTWRIHADFPGMMAGGIAALMLQTLHPLALAGVWDHSSFRTDILGRLRRTTAFVAGTTYAPAAEAQRLIERVRGLHRRVRGVAPDGRRYSAMNPALLTWVHCTEMSSFIAGFQYYRNVRLPTAAQDRYYAETARIARALGARRVPGSTAEMDEYFTAVQPELQWTDRSQAVLDVLAAIALPIPLQEAARGIFLGAGAHLLPAWARTQLRWSRSEQWRHHLAARTLRQVSPLLRAALRQGVAARACHRVGMAYDDLQRLPHDSD